MSNRRQFVAAAATFSLAGCLAGDSGGDVNAADGTADAETAVRENAAAGVLTEESHQFEAAGELTHVALHPTDDSRLVVTHSFA